MNLILKFRWTLTGLFLILSGTVTADLVDFEELSLAPESFYNGGPVTNTNGWTASAGTAGNVHFGNNYDSAFGGFWNGFSYSNVTDTTTPGFGNQYAAYAGAGAAGSANFAVGFAGSHAFINLQTDQRIESVSLTNTTYAALSMLNGDAFAKKFGGASGTDPDFYCVTFTGYALADATGSVTGEVEYFLADYRSDLGAEDYIIDAWEALSLTPLANARSIGISFDSSDIGTFGINTPTYVALDNLVVSTVPEPTAVTWLLAIGMLSFTRRKR